MRAYWKDVYEVFFLTGQDNRKKPHKSHVLRLGQPETFGERCLYLGTKLPGQKGSRFALRLYHIYMEKAQKRFWDTVRSLPKRSLCIDLGANVGDVSAGLLECGMRVVAFEPDPITFAKLEERIGHDQNATLYCSAAGPVAANMQLSRTDQWDPKTLAGSEGSSLVHLTGNMDTDNAVIVPVVDFPEFLRSLDEKVAIIKMDIEGGEWDLVPALLKDDTIGCFDNLFVETHEWIDQSKVEVADAWRAKSAISSRPKMHFDWV